MHQNLARFIFIAVVFILIGCAGGGNSVIPDPGNETGNDNQAVTEQQNVLTPNIEFEEPEEIILGNFTYTSDENEVLAWGTILLTREGWDYRIDYIAPRLRALMQSGVTREAQSAIDLTWLKLIDAYVTYTNKPEPIPPDVAEYEPGEWMEYCVNIQNNLRRNLTHLTVVASQVDMFNQLLGDDAEDTWTKVHLPNSGIRLNADWTVEPDLPNGFYFTRVYVGAKVFQGWITVVIFDRKAGVFKVEDTGPQYFDPVAKGVTTTPIVGVGETVHVQDNGSFDPDGGGIVEYAWDFNEDGVWDAFGPSADTSYPTPGTYYINLRVTDDEGATDDLTDDPGDELIEIIVTPPPVPPVAIAEASKYEAYVDEEITFDGTDSYDPDGGSIVLYEWDWENDGTYDSIGAVVNHSYPTAGTYYVQLQVTDDENQQDTLDQPLEIVIIESQLNPTACFTWSPENPVPCETVTLNAECSTDQDGEIVQYLWDLDNDGTWDVDTQNPIYETAFDEPGDYQVTLKVVDDDGNEDTTYDIITVVNALPTAVGVADKNDVDIDEEISFDGSGSYDNDCDGDSIVQWEWDWESDGVYDDTGEYQTHSYDESGTYYVQLRVTDDEGGTDTLDQPIVINVAMQLFDPIALADASPNPQTVCEDVTLEDDGSYDPDGGPIVLYEWDIDNDGTYDYTGASITYAWTTPGTYYVQFRVTDDEGATGTLYEPLEIIIQNALPTASATADKYNAYTGETINFDGSASQDNDCNGQSITLWEWDWENDGTYDATGEYASHAYTNPGTYYVQLRVTDNEGATDTLDNPLMITVTTQLYNPVAIADASPNPQTVCEDVTLEDDGSYDPDGGPIVLYEWDIDNDGTYDYTGSSITYAWTTPGTYYVQFRVTDDEGATDTLDTPLEILIQNALPTASAVADKYNAYTGEKINFDGSGSQDNDCNGQSITLWEWDWNNDGTYDGTGQYANHTYYVPGVYNVQLRVTDNEGATDTLDTPLVITVSTQLFDPIALADASPNPQTVCADVTLEDDGSYDPDGGPIVLYEWDIDNNGTYDYTGASITYAWNTPGTYYVQFRVTDDEGAKGTLYEPMEIIIQNALPTASASADKYNAGVGETINFDGSASQDNDCNGQSITLWEWDWENDGTYDATGEYASHAYTNPGIYYVQLRVTDNEGATDTLDTPLEITITLSCPTGIHEYDPMNPASQRGIAQHYSTFAYSVLPRADIAYIESGSYGGQGLVQGGPNSLVTFNPDIDSNDPIDDVIFKYPTGGGAGPLAVTSIDSASYANMVAIVTSDKPYELRLLDSSVFLGEFYPFSHSFGSDAQIMAVDFDSDGTVWVVVRHTDAGDIYLYHAAYTGDDNYHTSWSSTSIGSYTGTNADVFDIAISWDSDMLYLFDAYDGYGRVTAFDISTPSSPTVAFVSSSLFSSMINYVSDETIGIAGFADIEIDHMGTDEEQCHILLYARFGDANAELHKYDDEMTQINVSYYYGSVWPCMTINPESVVTDRDLMLPGESKMGFWFAPSTW